jgi:hypothetical protein
VSTRGSVRIVPLADEHVDDVIQIHLAGMGYSLNSRLGRDHLRFLYQTIAGDPGGYASVALVGERPAGVVTGVLDSAKFTTSLMQKMPASRIVATATCCSGRRCSGVAQARVIVLLLWMPLKFGRC